MDSLELEFKPIQRGLIWGLLTTFVPTMIVGLLSLTISKPENQVSTSYLILLVVTFTSLVLTLGGYVFCWIAACRYATYKGYPKYLGFIAGSLNFFGISFLFLLDNRREVKTEFAVDNDFDTLSLWSILLAYFAIAILIYPFLVLGVAFGGKLGIATALELLSDTNIAYLASIIINLVIFWYYYKRFVGSQINFLWLLGWNKKINILLPLSLAIAMYFFAWGFNHLTLYGISFIYPEYLEYLTSQGQASTVIGFVSFFILAVIFAPLWEEILFRGIIFQKFASTKSIFWGIIYSSAIFAIIHFRFDLIPLFIIGIITTLLYCKTKQLMAPILLHFFYNLIVVGRQIYLITLWLVVIWLLVIVLLNIKNIC